nr:MAG TPA: hypothetical protein [Caudoviricetes sp.]
MQVLRSARGVQMILLSIIVGCITLWAHTCLALDKHE